MLGLLQELGPILLSERDKLRFELGFCFLIQPRRGMVRVATGTPTSRKSSSWPAGEQMRSILASRGDELWNW